MLVVLLGCDATQHIQRGDAALRAGQPREALASYQRAMQSDPKLRGDPTFAANLREASWRTAFQDAEASAAAGTLDRAIGQYEETLRHNPRHPDAAAGLARAQSEAARQRFERAIQSADRGDLKAAGDDLRQALLWDAGHANARAALDSLDRRGNAASEQRFAAALQRVEQRDWQRAADEFTSIINIDTTHLPSRAELAKANAAMAESRKAQELASRLLAEKKLDDAVAAGRRAVDIWPTSGEASDTLGRAQAARDRAEQLLAQARRLAGEGDYEGASAAALQSLEVYPGHAGARKFSGEIRQTAADAFVSQARRQLAAGEVEAAASSFRSALSYMPEHRAAKDGLVEVAYAHGQGAEKEGLWGNALLWYMDAAGQRPTGEYKQAESRARGEIAKRVGFDLAVSVADGRGNTNGDTAALASRLAADAGKSKPDFVTLVPPDARPRQVESLPRPLYRAMVTMRSIQVQQTLVSREKKNHTYNASRAVPNPSIPGLESDLIRAERDLALARSRLIRYDCNDCGGRGHIVCRSCRGTKWNECSVCNGSGRVKVKGGIYQVCNACGGNPRTPCRTCGGAGHLRCDRCGGRGFYNDYDQPLIRSQERLVGDLRYRLRREQATVQEQYAITWPYEQEIYQKTGKLDSSVRIEDAATGEAVQSFEVTPSYLKQDAVIVGANPQVGLTPDGLDLPTDEAVYRAMIEEAAKASLDGALIAATVARANAFIAQANDHAKAGKSDLDIEARVAAMVLLEPTQPKEAKRLLDEIRNPK